MLKGLLGLVEKPNAEIDFVVGAGTGIWTRMVHDAGVRSLIAVEPNEDMRNRGILIVLALLLFGLLAALKQRLCRKVRLIGYQWLRVFIGLILKRLAKEFHRVLRPSGRLTALWNPRLIELNPLLVEIESYLIKLHPDLKRVSSGRSGITETLTEKLLASEYFDDVVYVEGRHSIEMNPSRYLGAWRSVNDVRVQLGPENLTLLSDLLRRKLPS